MHQYSAPIMRLVLISTTLRKININQLNNISNNIIKLASLKEPQMKTDVGNNTKHLDRNKVIRLSKSILVSLIICVLILTCLQLNEVSHIRTYIQMSYDNLTLEYETKI